MDAEGIAGFEREMDAQIAAVRWSGKPEPARDPVVEIRAGRACAWCQTTPLYVTRGLQACTNPMEVLVWFSRHFTGDFGELCPEDLEANLTAISKGLRVLSVYHTEGGSKVYIITEADRSSTTALLAEEY
jgi:hypothetical protein